MKWRLTGSTCMRVNMDSEATWPIETLMTGRANMFLALLCAILVIFTGDGGGLAAWRWEGLRLVWERRGGGDVRERPSGGVGPEHVE